jgi:hypothetical protein
MPKDATKNVDRYKVRGGHLNEFEFNENQEALAARQPKDAAVLIPGTPPEEKVEGLQPVVRKTPKPAKKRATKAKATQGTRKAARATRNTKATKTSTRGASAKKLAARKAAAKK